MRVIDPTVLISSPADRAVLTTYISTNPGATFDEIRLNVPLLSGLNDGALHQVAIDAGLEVIDD